MGLTIAGVLALDHRSVGLSTSSCIAFCMVFTTEVATNKWLRARNRTDESIAPPLRAETTNLSGAITFDFWRSISLAQCDSTSSWITMAILAEYSTNRDTQLTLSIGEFYLANKTSQNVNTK